MKDEVLWERSIDTVSRNEHLPEEKFTDAEWAKVDKLYELLLKKENN
jgi:hypothetical protein